MKGQEVRLEEHHSDRLPARGSLRGCRPCRTSVVVAVQTEVGKTAAPPADDAAAPVRMLVHEGTVIEATTGARRDAWGKGALDLSVPGEHGVLPTDTAGWPAARHLPKQHPSVRKATGQFRMFSPSTSGGTSPTLRRRNSDGTTASASGRTDGRTPVTRCTG